MGNSVKGAFDVQDFLARVGAGKTIRNVQKNETVFLQGDAADTVYYIQRGKIKVTVISKHEKEAVVGIMGPGQFFGEGCMNYQTSYEGRASRSAGVFRAVRGISSDPEQPD